jgi:dienelactone hydrolase
VHIIWIILFTIGIVLSDAPEAKDNRYTKYMVYADGVEINVFVYQPIRCKHTDILVVFHGLKRKAKKLRDKVAKIADQACLNVFAPEFTKKEFPNWRYHRAGVFRSGKIQPQEEWSDQVLHSLLRKIRAIVDNQSSRLFLFGHSAGGQFLSRIAAYSSPLDVDRIVIANPSVYVLPSVKVNAPNGFAGIFSDHLANTKLKEYLALPIIIYLGGEDTGEKYLVKSKQAMQQGKNRLERGRYVFQLGKQVARKKGWPFNWQVVEVPGIGHSSKGMLRATELIAALGLSDHVIK